MIAVAVDEMTDATDLMPVTCRWPSLIKTQQLRKDRLREFMLILEKTY